MMTPQAPSHPRELVSGREADLLDVAVALLASDVAVEMGLMAELQMRRGDDEGRDLGNAVSF